MDRQRAAEIQVALEGVRLPASRNELVRYAAAQDTSLAAELTALLPDREFTSLDEVGEALAPVQPRRLDPAKPPMPESGKAPGGDAYLLPLQRQRRS